MIDSGQWRATPDGSDGIHGKRGNVLSVSYRLQKVLSGSNPTLSANMSFFVSNNLVAVVDSPGCNRIQFRPDLRLYAARQQARLSHVGAQMHPLNGLWLSKNRSECRLRVCSPRATDRRSADAPLEIADVARNSRQHRLVQRTGGAAHRCDGRGVTAFREWCAIRRSSQRSCGATPELSPRRYGRDR